MKNGIYDFSKGVYWVDEDKLLRPSGECIIYPQFRRWIKTHNDLPLRAFQVGTAYRKLTPRGLFRLREQDLFIEGHTAHATRQEAEKQLDLNIKLVNEVLEYIGLPTIFIYRPIWNNKPVSEKTIGFDTLLPNGETVLVACAYSQMQVFSKQFKIQFINKNNEKEYTYQTEFGLSAKPILALLFLSSDEYGLNIIPELAPTQIIIIPITNKNNIEKIMSYSEKIKKQLIEKGLRVKIDSSNKSVGRKRYLYEKNGIPLRIEIGENEINDNKITVFSRETKEKIKINTSKILNQVEDMLNVSSKKIKERIHKKHSENIIKYKFEEKNVINLKEKLIKI